MTATAAYRSYLAEHAELVQSFAIDDLDRTGVPVWNASAWGPHPAHGVGYGETPEEAQRSAFGEAVETLAAARWADAVQPVERSVDAALADGGIHPAELSLPVGTEVDGATRLLWVEAMRWPDGERRLLPLEAVATCPEEFALAAGDGRDPLFPPITNGLGAGEELERAVAHGLRELVQRDLNWSSFKALDTGRTVDARLVAPDLVERLARLGVTVRLKYSGAVFGVHAFHCAGTDADPDVPPLVRTATGEGADENPRVAARKALLEFCSSRARKLFSFGGEQALAVAPPSYRERAELIRKATPRERGWDLRERFDALLGDPDALEEVVARITSQRRDVPLPEPSKLDLAGAEVIVVPLSSDEAGVRVARVTVPGLEAEVLSHHRLGPRGVARLAERLPDVVAPRPGPGRAPVAGTSAWVDVPALEALAAQFMPLYREPARHSYDAPAVVRV